MPLGTGFSDADSRDDFNRVRRQQALSRLASRLIGRPGDVSMLLPFDEVIAALGFRSERRLGEQVIPLDSIVGSVDRGGDFDRRFRPTSNVARRRFERIDAAQRRGEAMPPIDVYQVGEVYFVRDGHHRVAVARARGWDSINAYVSEVLTEVGANRNLRLSDLPLKGHQRMFYERVPLSPPHRAAIELGDPMDFAMLAEGVEAWGFRSMQEQRRYLSREEVAQAWFTQEYQPVLELLRESGLLTGGTETEIYLRLSAERYRLLRSHTWDERALEVLRRRR